MSDKTPLIAADEAGLAKAAEMLREGRLVAMPTETVYGLAARADSAEAVAQIYRTKGRPDFNPLIVHVASLAMAHELAVFNPAAEKLAAAFWPGPLTLVLPLRKGAGIAPAVTAGLGTIALRQPAHPIGARLLAQTGLPLAAPSANRSNAVSPTRPEHVLQSLGADAPLILDGGSCAAGLESTIVATTRAGDWRILRPGPISEAALADVLGSTAKSCGATLRTARVEAPGQLAKHYSPGKPVLLNVTNADPTHFLIGFGDMPCDTNLSPAADLAEAAARLYAALHEAAASDKQMISVAPIPDEDMGQAINDRLRRAAAT